MSEQTISYIVMLVGISLGIIVSLRGRMGENDED